MDDPDIIRHKRGPLHEPRRPARRLALALTFLAWAAVLVLVGWLARPAEGMPGPRCDVALSIGVDVSSSVGTVDQGHVTRGLREALLSPGVLDAVDGQNVWFYAFTFSATAQQLVGWSPVSSREDMLGFVAAMGDISGHGGTSLPVALNFARAAFDAAPPCGEYILDLQTDGNPDSGASEAGGIRAALNRYERYVHTVNVLYVGEDLRMLEFVEREVRFGPKSFVRRVPTYAEYPAAMRAKLILELGSCRAVCAVPLEVPL